MNATTLRNALSDLCDALEPFAPEDSRLHYARGLLAGVRRRRGSLAHKYDAIIQRYQSGSKPAAIAREMGVNVESVYYIIRSRNIPKPPKAASPPKGYKWDEHAQAMAADYTSDMTLLEVAAKFGTHSGVVRKTLARHGVAIRPKNSQRNGQKLRIDRIEAIMAMRAEGKDMVQIGRALGVSRERIRQNIVAAGKLEEFGDQRPFTPYEKEVLARYDAGQGMADIAAALGVGEWTARQYLIRFGATIRPSGRRAEQRAERKAKAEIAAELYRDGMKAKDIAAHLGLKAAEEIYRLLSYAGCPRDRSKAA
jgi:DNA-binding CsgD family transcriptional regulator